MAGLAERIAAGRPRVVLASTATRWLGTARMPRVLARAGFDVTLLAPENSLAAKSRYVSSARIVSATATPMEWLLALVGIVDRASPALLVPCDEMAVRLLFALALEPPAGFAADLHRRLVALITRSLGDPAFYAVSIDKTMLPMAAESLGVCVPMYAVAADARDAAVRAAELGYPVVLKRRFGFAGHGVAIVASESELLEAAQRLLRQDPLDLGEQRSPQILVQAYVRGAYHSQALAAWAGAPVAAFGWERYVATSAVKGQTAVVRFIESPASRAFAETLCRGFGMSGLFNVQFVVDEQTGDALLLEINRRIVTHMHLGERVRRDLGRALHLAVTGESNDGAVEETVSADPVVVFPREWLRDAESRHLRDLPVDVPWDEPELFAAMLAMRHES